MDESTEHGPKSERKEGSWLRRLRRSEQAPPESGGGQSAPSAPPQPRPQGTSASAIWTDSHCHLQDEPDPAETVAQARAARVGRMVCVGTDEASSRRAVELAAQLSSGQSEPAAGGQPAPVGRGVEVYATVGLHPHDAKAGLDSLTDLIGELEAGEGLRRSRVVAIGECGLDYHYDNSPRAVQKDVFRAQIGLANRHSLALVVHTREAWEDTFAILEEEGVPQRTVFHCFSGGEQEAKACLRLGGFLSFSGIVTFANAEELRQVAVHCPLDSLLIETDSPFLTPVPHRGRRNSPANVVLVGQAICELKAFEPEVLAAVTWMNTDKAFGLGG